MPCSHSHIWIAILEAPSSSPPWCFLFNIIDCYTREWLSYTFSKECGTDEALRALNNAVAERFPDGNIPDLTIRNDGDPQYTSDRFIQTLNTFKIKHEVTGKNRPDEDAYIEAFHRWLKEDYIWQQEFQTFNEADSMIKEFFTDYNWKRPHSSLNYMTPKEFYRYNGGNP
jgi:putative transposase